jgi:mono/diheme cytochrome c family protein
MKYLKTFVWAAFIAFIPVMLAFTTSQKASVQNTTASDSASSPVITGAALFQKNCAVCHGADLNGRPPAFPSLKEVQKKMTKYQIVALLKTGRNAMPSFAHLSDAEREALTGFLYGEKTKSAVQTSLTPAEQGRNLFVANCSQCHKVKPNDPRPTGQRNMGMIPPVLGGITQVLDLPRFERILNMGPCYMPSFTFLSPQEKNHIYTFLKTYEDSIPGLSGRSRFRNGMGCRGW